MRALFIAGWAESPRAWDATMLALSDRFTSVAIGSLELLGSESSLADYLNTQPPFAMICGWSLGGMLLLEQLSLGITLPPCAVVCAAGRFTADSGPTSVSGVRAMRRQLRTDPAAAVERFLQMIHRVPSPLISAGELYSAGREAELARGLEFLEESDFNERLAQCATLPPLLFVHGAQDSLLVSSAVEYTAAACRGSERLELAAGHAPMEEIPDEFARVLLEWSERCCL